MGESRDRRDGVDRRHIQAALRYDERVAADDLLVARVRTAAAEIYALSGDTVQARVRLRQGLQELELRAPPKGQDLAEAAMIHGVPHDARAFCSCWKLARVVRRDG
jgi:hypothetical protein